MTEQGYEFFEHTADVGVRVWGSTVAEFLTQAAKALTELLVTESPVAVAETRPIALTAVSTEELLVAWLNELLFWFATDRFLVSDCQIEATETTMTGQALGERFNPKRHAQGTEVKGVTHHQLQVERTSHGWKAELIFDV